MASKQFTKALVAVSVAGIVAVGGMVIFSARVRAQDPTSLSQIVQIGLNSAIPYSAIPCISNTGSPYANLINVCPK